MKAGLSHRTIIDLIEKVWLQVCQDIDLLRTIPIRLIKNQYSIPFILTGKGEGIHKGI